MAAKQQYCLQYDQHRDKIFQLYLLLIHMNGRVYDYNLGRFMSVDPFIQSPTNSQSMNPYSYIMNNPLSGTDPTGYKGDQEEEVKQVEKISSEATTGSRLKSTTKISSTTSGGKTTATKTVSNGAGQLMNTAYGSSASGSSGGTTAIGAPESISKNNSTNVGGTPSGGGSLQGQIKSDAHNSIVRAGEEMGVNMGGGVSDGVNAEWGSINRDGDGNITQASVVCGMSCRAEAGLYSYEHSMDLIRIRNQNDYGALATKSLAYTGLAFTGSYYALSAGGSYLAASPTAKALMFEFMAQASMDVRAVRTMMQMDTIPAHMQSLLRGGSKWFDVTKGKLPTQKPRLPVGKNGKPRMPIYNKG